MRPKPFRSRCKVRTGDLRQIRIEGSLMYSAWCRGEITNEDLRSGSLALARMATIDAGQGMEQRIAELEAKLAAERPPSRPNGSFHARP